MSKIIDEVKAKYGSVADSDLSNNHAGVRSVAEAFGYSAEELTSIPADANMGLSCGNPTAMASLKPGEVVVDLGCGGGLDVFLAAQKVGATGKAIGIDMTVEMIERAKKNAAAGTASEPITNVEFHLATIDKLPLPDASVDVVISNCVINLAEDKDAVFREIIRVLKPGGRLAVSDIALKKPLPPEIASDVMAFVGCIAGAIQISEYHWGLTAAGFSHIQVLDFWGRPERLRTGRGPVSVLFANHVVFGWAVRHRQCLLFARMLELRVQRRFTEVSPAC